MNKVIRESYKQFYQIQEVENNLFINKQTDWSEITPQQQEGKGKIFSEKDIWEALNSMNDNASTRADGLGVKWYKKFIDIMVSTFKLFNQFLGNQLIELKFADAIASSCSKRLVFERVI